MKRTIKAALLAVVLVIESAVVALAATHAPCGYHHASAPTILKINADGTTTLSGSAAVGSCPSPIGTESASVTATLQARDASGVFVDVGIPETATRGWSRISRYPRQVSAIGTATCTFTDWRTRGVSHEDTTVTFYSDVVRYVPSDSGRCTYGGQD